MPNRSRPALAFFLCLLSANAEYVTRKLCKDEAPSLCNVHHVTMDPCAEGPGFCGVKRSKAYTLHVDLTPQFSAEDLKLAMYADDQNTGSFDKMVKTPEDGCHSTPCPVDADVRRAMDVNFSLDKTLAFSKFPIKVKLWNNDDESQACCFTFTVKVNK